MSKPGKRGGRGGEEPALDVAGDAEVALDGGELRAGVLAGGGLLDGLEDVAPDLAGDERAGDGGDHERDGEGGELGEVVRGDLGDHRRARREDRVPGGGGQAREEREARAEPEDREQDDDREDQHGGGGERGHGPVGRSGVEQHEEGQGDDDIGGGVKGRAPLGRHPARANEAADVGQGEELVKEARAEDHERAGVDRAAGHDLAGERAPNHDDADERREEHRHEDEAAQLAALGPENERIG